MQRGIDQLYRGLYFNRPITPIYIVSLWCSISSLLPFLFVRHYRSNAKLLINILILNSYETVQERFESANKNRDII